MTVFVRYVLIFFACLSLALPAAIASERQHQIDIWLQKTVEEDTSTAGMRNATIRARELWDQEMNRAYKNLMARLNADQQSILKESQRNWIKFRDSEFRAISSIVASMDGTMWQLIATNNGMEIVRQRALQLIAYESAVIGE